MVGAHEASAIAQIVFYVPMVPVSFYNAIHAWKYGPRMAWYPPMPFSLVRLVGGCLVVAQQHEPRNVGLLIATVVLLNVGVIPLVMSFHSLIRLILETNFKGNNKTRMFVRLMRCGIFAAVGLMAAAGGLTGKPEDAQTQSTLSKVAYVEFLCVLAALMSMCSWLYFQSRHNIKPSQVIYLKWLLVVSPALCVRTAYSLIGVFQSTGSNTFNSTWSPLFGSALAFSLMALLPEYIALCIYLYLGFHRFRTSTLDSVADERPKRKWFWQKQSQKEMEQHEASGSAEMA